MRFFAIILLSLLIGFLMYCHKYFLAGVSPALLKYVLIIFVLAFGWIFYLIYKEPVIKFKLIQTGILISTIICTILFIKSETGNTSDNDIPRRYYSDDKIDTLKQ